MNDSKRRTSEAEAPSWNGPCTKKQEVLLVQRESNLQRLQSMHEGTTEEEEMKRHQRVKVMKIMTKKIRTKGRMDADSSWWVGELLVADCEKARLRAGWEHTMPKWFDWPREMKKR